MAKLLLKNTTEVKFNPDNTITVKMHDFPFTREMCGSETDKQLWDAYQDAGWHPRFIIEYFPKIIWLGKPGQGRRTYITDTDTMAITDWGIAKKQYPNTVWFSVQMLERSKREERKLQKKYGPNLYVTGFEEIMVHELAHCIMLNKAGTMGSENIENQIIALYRKSLLTDDEKRDLSKLLQQKQEIEHGKIFRVLYSQFCEKYGVAHNPEYWERNHKRDPFKKMK